MANLNEFLFGNESKMKGFNKQSLGALLQMLQGGGLQGNPLFESGSNFLQQLFNPSSQSMQDFQAPYMENFNQNIVPDIANRFAGMGTGASGLSSSGFQQTLGQAGRGLQKDLASMRGQMQMQGAGQALNYAQQPISNMMSAAGMVPNQYYERPGQQGLVQGGLNSFLQGFGNSFGGGF